MSKRRDRVFHVTVSVFALTLAAIAGGTLVSETTHRGLPPSWSPFHLLSQTSNQLPTQTGSAKNQDSGRPALNSTQQTGNTASQSANRTGSQAGHSVPNGLAAMPVYKPANNASHIIVSAPTGDVPAATVAHVKQLLTTYQMANTVSHTLQMNLNTNVHIYLAKTAADYQRDLNSLFGISLSQAKSFSADTGGFTQNESILIPLYQNTDDPDLANTLAHELTHAFLNDNTSYVPSWINEGLAVGDGMNMQARVENSVRYAGDARSLAESVMQAAANGTLLPLTPNEQAVLSGNAPYDLELQDWLAVKNLVLHFGPNAFPDYLYRLKKQESPAQAFQRTFGESTTAYNQAFTALLKKAAATPDAGVTLTFNISPSFHGDLRLLQHSSHTWQGFQATPGTDQVTMTPSGQLSGSVHKLQGTYDSTKPDNHTLYINLDSLGNLTQSGQTVQNCGMAIDYHNGLYGYVNSWITWANGKTTYLYTPSLFGVTLTQVSEGSQQNPVLQLLNTPGT